jgi:hypothetical protein
MALFKKKEDVPEIPTASTLPNLPSIEQTEKKELPELPSFPANSKNKNINQEMVKSAVTDTSFPGENEVHVDIPEGLHIKEERQGEPTIPPKPSVKSTIPEPPTQPSIVKSTIPEPPTKPTTVKTTPTTKHPTSTSDEPIFIRIDKFQLAQKHFEQIKEKINKIELVIGKIKEVKSKEEIELKGWTEDIEQIKTRLSEIDADIFDQI